MIPLDTKSFFNFVLAALVVVTGCEKHTAPSEQDLLEKSATVWFPDLPKNSQEQNFEKEGINYSQDRIDIAKWTERFEALGYSVDLSVFEGLPKKLAVCDLEYFSAALDEFREFAPGAQPAMRTEYILYNHSGKPAPKM